MYEKKLGAFVEKMRDPALLLGNFRLASAAASGEQVAVSAVLGLLVAEGASKWLGRQFLAHGGLASSVAVLL